MLQRIKKNRKIAALKVLKKRAYERLLNCREPEQAKLQSRIKATAGEARTLENYRKKVTETHNPFKKR